MKFKFGLVGGGEISHRHVKAVTSRGRTTFTAGCFSRNTEKNYAYASRYEIPAERVYENYDTMARIEAEREDRPDFVIVTTPNNDHYEICKAFLEKGFPVVCDKPLTVDSEKAEDLARISTSHGIPICVTYTFVGNPFLHLMKALYIEGKIGKAYYLNLTFLHGRRLAQIMKDKTSSWRFLSDISGPAGAVGDLGAHLEYVSRFICGSDVFRVLARLVVEPGGIETDSTATVLFETSEGLAGSMQIAQLACGYKQDFKAEIWADAGRLSWNFTTPDELRADYTDGHAEIFREPGITHPAIRKFDRIVSSNTDKDTACFINIYDEFLTTLEDRRAGRKSSAFYPTVEDGVKGVRFIDACIESHRRGNIWVNV
jgi:predicted dehydrogenase